MQTGRGGYSPAQTSKQNQFTPSLTSVFSVVEYWSFKIDQKTKKSPITQRSCMAVQTGFPTRGSSLREACYVQLSPPEGDIRGGTRTRLEVRACRSTVRTRGDRPAVIAPSSASTVPQNISLVDPDCDRFLRRRRDQSPKTCPSQLVFSLFAAAASARMESALQGVSGGMLLKMSTRLSSPHR